MSDRWLRNWLVAVTVTATIFASLMAIQEFGGHETDRQLQREVEVLETDIDILERQIERERIRDQWRD